MARKQKITVCALNVIIHDEGKRDYKKLFQFCAELHLVAQFNRTHAASLVSTSSVVTPMGEYLFGLIYKFVNVEPPYFDSHSHKIVYDAEGKPKNLLSPQIKANTKDVEFCLFDEIHRVFVNTKNITPKTAKSFFEKIFSDIRVVQEFGQVDVALHTSSESVDSILNIYSLKCIEVTVHRPNPISLSRYDGIVEESMRQQNAETLQFKLSTKKGDITPDETTHSFMQGACNNGRIRAIGRDQDGKKIEYDTDDVALTASTLLQKGESFVTGVIRAASNAWNKISSQGES